MQVLFLKYQGGYNIAAGRDSTEKSRPDMKLRRYRKSELLVQVVPVYRWMLHVCRILCNSI